MHDTYIEGMITGLKCSDGQTVLVSKDLVTIDGSRGTIYQGALQTIIAGQDADFQTLLRWADKYKRMDVYGVGDTGNESFKSVTYGADGNFVHSTDLFTRSGLGAYQTMKKELMTGFLIATGEDERRKILDLMLPLIRDDYIYIFRQCHEKQIKITLFDPKVSDFLPKGRTTYQAAFESDIRTICQKYDIVDTHQAILNAEHWLKNESSQCMGAGLSYMSKGDARLCMIYPHMTEMQVKAILGTVCSNNLITLLLLILYLHMDTITIRSCRDSV